MASFDWPVTTGGGGGGGGSAYWGDAVANFAALPVSGLTGEIRQTLNDASLYRWSGATWLSYFATSGSITGPGSSVNNEVVLFNGTTGSVLKRATGTGVAHLTSGVLSASAVNLATEVTGTLPAAAVQYLTTVTSDVQVQLDAKVSSSRLINTTGPLQGGGDLTADLTLAIDLADTATDGYLSSVDWNTFNSKEPAITVLPVSKGGTNSSTALNNNRVMQSSGGAVVEAAAITPAFALISDANGIPVASPVSDTELGYVQGVTSSIQTQLDSKEPAVLLPTNRFVFSNQTTGALDTYAGWSYNTTTGGANLNLDENPNNTAAGYNVHNFQVNLIPLQDSPNDSYNNINFFISIDPTSQGFDMGTNGQCSTMINSGFTHAGTSDIGALQFISHGVNIGNGTDPVDVRGFTALQVGGGFASGVNLSANLSGVRFDLNVASGASFSAGTGGQAYGDECNIQAALSGWVSYNATPNILSIRTNSNYVGMNINPQIDTMAGNSGFYGMSLGGVINTLGTSGYHGVQVNPQLADLSQNCQGITVLGQSTTGSAEWIGVDSSPSQIVTTGKVRAIRASVTRDLTKDILGLEVNGGGSIQTNMDLVSGLGQVSGNTLGGGITLPNATAITGTDVLANNLAFGITLGDAGSSFVSPSGLVGLTSVGFVGQVAGAGTADLVNFCLAGFAQAHTGHIDRVNNFSAAAIPTGAPGTIDDIVLYAGAYPFGFVATNSWGIRIDTDGTENYLPQLAIGTSNKKVTNSSVGLELDSTTRAVLFSRMTTTERDALTAVNGMQIYNTTSMQLEGYQNGSWSALGGGGTVPLNLTAQWLTADGLTKTITHGWGTRNIRVEVLDNSDNYATIVTDVTRPTDNTVVLSAAEVPASAWTVLLTQVIN